MKNFLIAFLVIVFYIFYLPKFVFGQTNPTENIPYVNCGVAENSNNNKCCQPAKWVKPQFQDLGTALNLARDVIVGPINLVIEKQVSPWFKYGEQVVKPCVSGHASTSDPADPSCVCVPETKTSNTLTALYNFCYDHKNVSERKACWEGCALKGGIYTGLGCIQTDTKKFIEETVFGLGIGLAGMASLLCIIYAAFTMQSSQGNPEKIKKAQELLTSCIMGLIVIIFSVFILRLIGVSILRIPGFK